MTYQLEILGKKINNPKGSIVFVHGICHGAWCWENFLYYFSKAGYQCYAVSLRGHGNSEGKENLNTFTLSDYVEDIKFVIDNKCITKPFLVGHSMGGAVVQQYIGKYEDTVQGAVLFAPATAPRMKFYQILPKNKNLWYATRVAWDMYDKFNIFGKSRGEIIHNSAFFTGKDKDGKRIQRIKDTSRFESLLQAESILVTTGGIINNKIKFADLIKRYSKNYNVHIPILVIGSYADRYFAKRSLKKTAKAYAKNGKTALVILERLCHDMMLDLEWRHSAKPVLKFIENPIDFINDEKKHWPRLLK